jgi:hypothetical protein
MTPHSVLSLEGGKIKWGECGINERMKWSGTRMCS